MTDIVDVVARIALPLAIAGGGWWLATLERRGVSRLVTEIKSIAEARAALTTGEEEALGALQERLNITVDALRRRNDPGRTSRALARIGLIGGPILAVALTVVTFVQAQSRGTLTTSTITLVVLPCVGIILISLRMLRDISERAARHHKG